MTLFLLYVLRQLLPLCARKFGSVGLETIQEYSLASSRLWVPSPDLQTSKNLLWLENFCATHQILINHAQA